MAAISAACLSLPLQAVAQTPSRTFRVGILAPRRRPDSLESDYFGQIPAGLRELGYVEGRNLSIEWRFADGEYGRLPELAMGLVRAPVDVIVADGSPASLAAQHATKTIPIIFVNVGDPIGIGLVKTLANPGGNTTGLSLLGPDTAAKQFEMLGAVAPRARVAILWNPANPSGPIVLRNLQDAARITHTTTIEFEGRTPGDIARAFAWMGKERPGALLVVPDQLFMQERQDIARQAVALRLPSMGNLREYAEAGGLMSYGSDRRESCRRAAAYVDKIFKGARPQDLPVEQPTKFELVINRKTAKAIGLEIPPELLVQADKVIE